MDTDTVEKDTLTEPKLPMGFRNIVKVNPIALPNRQLSISVCYFKSVAEYVDWLECYPEKKTIRLGDMYESEIVARNGIRERGHLFRSVYVDGVGNVLQNRSYEVYRLLQWLQEHKGDSITVVNIGSERQLIALAIFVLRMSRRIWQHQIDINKIDRGFFDWLVQCNKNYRFTRVKSPK